MKKFIFSLLIAFIFHSRQSIVVQKQYCRITVICCPICNMEFASGYCQRILLSKLFLYIFSKKDSFKNIKFLKSFATNLV